MTRRTKNIIRDTLTIIFLLIALGIGQALIMDEQENGGMDRKRSLLP